MDNSNKQEIEILEKQIIELQKKLYDWKIPVILIIEHNLKNHKNIRKGINKLALCFDPRDYKLYFFEQIISKKYFLFYPFWRRIPAKGKITIFDGSYYQYLFKPRSKISFQDLFYFEQLLSDENYKIIKIFIQKPNNSKSKSLKFLEKTNFDFSKWNIIQYNKKTLLNEIYKIILYNFNEILENKNKKQKSQIEVQNQNKFEFKYLNNVNLNQQLSEEEYKTELENYTKQLSKFQKKLLKEKIPLILLFEGWDASGKGGTIRRLVKSLDPRYYNLIPISAPNEREKQFHYLWRFWTQLPEKGYITIFDRSWYGRVLVERVEGLCSEEEWKRAYKEINEIERILTEDGILIKFWLHIDKDTQYKRFLERQNTPHKQWKITEEDWRNREKWELYEIAIEEMIQKTNTSYAPWNIIEFNYKWFGRIKTFKIIIETLKKFL